MRLQLFLTRLVTALELIVSPHLKPCRSHYGSVISDGPIAKNSFSLCTVMANVPPMGPPPSPKEPRRSGRRSVPSHSSSKSPAPSPHPESAPRLKESRPMPPSSSSSRSKRSKQEEVDETFEDMPKPPTNHQSSGRNKRKPKDKQSTPTPASIDNNHTPKDTRVSEQPADTPAQEEEGITRCICGNAGSFTSWPYSALLTSPPSFTLS